MQKIKNKPSPGGVGFGALTEMEGR